MSNPTPAPVVAPATPREELPPKDCDELERLRWLAKNGLPDEEYAVSVRVLQWLLAPADGHAKWHREQGIPCSGNPADPYCQAADRAPQPEGGTVAPVTFHEGESDADFLCDLAADLESVRDKRRLETIISDGTTERLRKVASSLSARPAPDTSGEWERLLLDVMCFVETYGLKHEITAAAREALTAHDKARTHRFPLHAYGRAEMSDKHEWDFCSMCGPMVMCGYCGNNCCNGGKGENCPDNCASAYAKMDANDPTVAELKSLVSKAQRACHDAVMDRAAVWGELDLLGDEKSTAAVDAIRALRATFARSDLEAVAREAVETVWSNVGKARLDAIAREVVTRYLARRPSTGTIDTYTRDEVLEIATKAAREGRELGMHNPGSEYAWEALADFDAARRSPTVESTNE